jgi:hypothetical protein
MRQQPASRGPVSSSFAKGVMMIPGPDRVAACAARTQRVAEQGEHDISAREVSSRRNGGEEIVFSS